MGWPDHELIHHCPCCSSSFNWFTNFTDFFCFSSLLKRSFLLLLLLLFLLLFHVVGILCMWLSDTSYHSFSYWNSRNRIGMHAYGISERDPYYSNNFVNIKTSLGFCICTRKCSTSFCKCKHGLLGIPQWCYFWYCSPIFANIMKLRLRKNWYELLLI